jgi:hypothetical protein
MDEMTSNKNESHFESYTKNSIHSEQIESSDINMAVYKTHVIPENIKVNTGNSKRKITLKDFIFYLEGERRNPLNHILIHKAMMKLNP